MDARKPLDWRAGGLLLGLLAVAAVALQGPIGVSSAYVITEAALVNAVAPKLFAANAYWTSLGARLTPEWVGVMGMIVGGLAASLATRTWRRESIPETFRARFGPRAALRFTLTFAGGFLLLFGARLAGGCTSGHIISGMSQLAVSGMVFALATFASGIPTAVALYGRRS